MSEDLAERLVAAGWSVRTTSDRLSGGTRVLDMVASTWGNRRGYGVAHVEVYSGRAFRWAEAVTWSLRRLAKPFILTLHGGELPEFARRRPARVQALLTGASIVTAPSRYLVEGMRPYRAGIELVPNALDVHAYSYRQRGPAEPRLVWLRAFHEVYNPSLAPAVLARIVGEHPRAELVMIGADKGDGSLARARAAARSLGVADRVTFIEAVPKTRVPEVLASGDIFLNTTDADNTPVSVLEAQASGLCVVSTNVGGLSHLLSHGRDALLVPPRDPAGMASAVREILASPSLASALSSGARASAERFDWSRVLPRWEGLLTHVALSRAAATDDRS